MCLVLGFVAACAGAQVRPVVTAGLVNVGLGPTAFGRSGAPAVVMPFRVVELGAGAMVGERLGFAAGTAVLEGNLVSDVSFLPVRGYVLYDLTPGGRWRKGMAYASATYVHSGQDGWNGGGLGPYVRIAAGSSYTFYVLSGQVEAGYDWHWRTATLSAGVGLGGFYVLGGR